MDLSSRIRAAVAGGVLVVAASAGPALADTIRGTDGADVLEGTSGRDHVVAGQGADVIFTYRGNDSAAAGSGADHIVMGAGQDGACGGGGEDHFSAGRATITSLAATATSTLCNGTTWHTAALVTTISSPSSWLAAGATTGSKSVDPLGRAWTTSHRWSGRRRRANRRLR